ncbi:MAG TPA: type I DNA topoisomerase [Bacteroidales bacterium]|nr:type I DNA topoisomerase [Bacteroidales bacterium]
MIKNLVIVESPAKAKTIERFLGKDFTVRSSFGHVMDLSKKGLGVDIEKDFIPIYEISPEKKKVVGELKKAAKEAEVVWLATDEDREGEAISWHLVSALGLDEKATRRIVFHEITKPAILDAIDNPRQIDRDLVNAQQARRVLDRLVGFELSPLLWKKVKPALSAGRVQSVAVRLIVEREDEIKAFKETSSFKVTAKFTVTIKGAEYKFEAEFPTRFKTREEARKFLEKCIGASYKVTGIETRPSKKSPAPPFTTSTLQQEASRKLGFSVANTMRVAQQLYEEGLITYMRTDSVTLSKMALAMAKEEIIKLYGPEYSKTRQFATKTKGAQEAHEAIRPTYIANAAISGSATQKKLYELIWKRTIASQMSDALTEKTIVNISASTLGGEEFIAQGEVIKFDGFLKVYRESFDDDSDEEGRSILPPLSVGDQPGMLEMNAEQRFTQPQRRFTEASLVKRLEELGIGRPSTYAPTISTIQKREYVEKGDVEGFIRTYDLLTLKNNEIKLHEKKDKAGNEKGKLLPTDLGTLVNRFLMQYFQDIIDYQFTATVEKDFDEIAEGKKEWNEMIRKFYKPFHSQIRDTVESTGKFSGERLLGIDPGSGKNVYVKLGRFGPVVQIGETESDEKPRFAGLGKGQSLDTLTLEQALELFKFPRNLGLYENAEMIVAVGRFGPYIKHNNLYYSLTKQDDPALIDQERAISLIELKRKQDREKIIKSFPENENVVVMNGRFGPYIAISKVNYKIPKGTDPASLSLDECLQIAEKQEKSGKKKTIPTRKKS